MNISKIRTIATLAAATAAVAIVPSAASGASFSSGGPVDIPDQPGGMNPGASASVDVPGGLGQVSAVSVSLNIQHERLADLHASLTAPSGQKVSLMEQPCEFHAISAPLGFSDAAATRISRTDGFADGGCDGTPNQTMNGGTFRPTQPLASLAGQSAEGRWTVNVLDDSNHKKGKLNGYTLELDTTGVPAQAGTPAAQGAPQAQAPAKRTAPLRKLTRNKRGCRTVRKVVRKKSGRRVVQRRRICRR